MILIVWYILSFSTKSSCVFQRFFREMKLYDFPEESIFSNIFNHEIIIKIHLTFLKSSTQQFDCFLHTSLQKVDVSDSCLFKSLDLFITAFRSCLLTKRSWLFLIYFTSRVVWIFKTFKKVPTNFVSCSLFSLLKFTVLILFFAVTSIKKVFQMIFMFKLSLIFILDVLMTYLL